MPVVKYSEFDLKNLHLSEPVENKTIPEITKYQLLSVPAYEVDGKDEMPTIQGPWMALDYYGIPAKNDRSGKPYLNAAGQPLSDQHRGKLKIPFDLDDADSKKLYDFLSAIDKKCVDERDAIFGDKKKANAYRYQAIVRKAVQNPDAPEDAEPRPDYFVLKFDFDNKTKLMKSKIFVNDDGDRTEADVKTLDDAQKLLRYKCQFRPIMTISKLYAARSAGGDGKRSYGLGLKIKMVEVKPMKQSSEETETFFIDSDVEEEVERKQLVSDTTKKVDDSKAETKGRKKASAVI
jgi:hypothetical protein